MPTDASLESANEKPSYEGFRFRLGYFPLRETNLCNTCRPSRRLHLNNTRWKITVTSAIAKLFSEARLRLPAQFPGPGDCAGFKLGMVLVLPAPDSCLPRRNLLAACSFALPVAWFHKAAIPLRKKLLPCSFGRRRHLLPGCLINPEIRGSLHCDLKPLAPDASAPEFLSYDRMLRCLPPLLFCFGSWPRRMVHGKPVAGDFCYEFAVGDRGLFELIAKSCRAALAGLSRLPHGICGFVMQNDIDAFRHEWGYRSAFLRDFDWSSKILLLFRQSFQALSWNLLKACGSPSRSRPPIAAR